MSGGGPSYYLCPFCVSSWVCDGPHIEESDIGKYHKKINIIVDDLAEYAKELIEKYGESLTPEQLGALVQQRLRDRQVI